MSEPFDTGREAMAVDALERELIDLGRWLSYPAASPAFTSRVTSAIQAGSSRPRRTWLAQPTWIFGRPVRRAVLLAVALLLALAAVAAAIGLGLPGLRITFGGPGSSPVVLPSRSVVPSAGALPGSTLGLGMPIAVSDAESRAGFDVLLPNDTRFGQPDAAYLLNGRLALVWGPRSGVEDTLEPGVSLVISEFRGRLHPDYFDKIVNTGTTVTNVTVRGARGFWVSGDPHFFFYVDPSGVPVDDTHRVVGDTLLWADGDITYRIESSLGREATIALAESMR